ncbi:MAG: c-type cytochrome [Gemmobacter sp.]|nr:c-type cytochrome [Gemmobacter sp.]
MTLFAAAALLPAAAFAEGDVEKGKALFNKCQTCHVVVNPAGETLAGKSAKTGPNLYNVAGQAAGGVEGFKYGNGIMLAREKGLVWDEANFVAYLANPTGFLKDFTGDKSVRGNMSFQVKKEDEAKDLHAFLVSLNPAE